MKGKVHWATEQREQDALGGYDRMVPVVACREKIGEAAFYDVKADSDARKVDCSRCRKRIERAREKRRKR